MCSRKVVANFRKELKHFLTDFNSPDYCVRKDAMVSVDCNGGKNVFLIYYVDFQNIIDNFSKKIGEFRWVYGTIYVSLTRSARAMLANTHSLSLCSVYTVSSQPSLSRYGPVRHRIKNRQYLCEKNYLMRELTMSAKENCKKKMHITLKSFSSTLGIKIRTKRAFHLGVYKNKI